MAVRDRSPDRQSAGAGRLGASFWVRGEERFRTEFEQDGRLGG